MTDELPENIIKAIKQVSFDNTSGSVELSKKSAEILIKLINQDSSIDQIKNASISLMKAQPNMASIFNLVNNLMLKIDRSKNKEPNIIANQYCKKYLENLEKSEKKICNNTKKLFKKNATIITHSYSSTVLNTLLCAKESGKKFSVICTESRPKNEGIKLAKMLGENNIKVKLFVDSAVFSLIPYADMILVGGDAVTDAGLVNKIGTKGLIMTAHHYYTPTYALCSTLKFLPKKYPVTLDHMKDPAEITKEKLSNVTPVNYYFDYTPIEYITGIISEKEILEPAKIKEKIKNLKIHKNLI
jgi:translation initiation factor 2B subunit (eIF-2B alpha/beta/delta family)